MGFTTERNSQIVISLLKYHGIRKIVASPGATNVSFVASVQNDPFFEVYSSVDERSAAYIACGMAAESGEPVVIACTGATASRNYLPALTEAYYRHLPVLAITYTMPIVRIGHNIPQCIDRTTVSNDVSKLSVHIPVVKDGEDEWICNIRANEAMLELKHGIAGPVHMNVETEQGGTFDLEQLPSARPVDRIMPCDEMPTPSERVAVYVGAHQKWSKALTAAVDEFCEKYDAVVLCDHTSNYKGKYACAAGLISAQAVYSSDNLKDNTVIHLGDVSGAYFKLKPKQVWRVSPDGRLCDNFRALRYVFEMDELAFFRGMNSLKTDKTALRYHADCMEEYRRLYNKMPEVPFSNIWLAKNTAARLPENSVLHLGILNSLRSWNLFAIPCSVYAYANTGGFGIDGCVSSLLGAALASPDKLFFGVVGDLALFYDMNVLGNRHFGNNVRLMVINNGRGQEFRNYGHRAAQFGEDTDIYIAAAGHYGNKSDSLLRDYACDLGFEYISASDKQSALVGIERFTTAEALERPVLFEVFTDSQDETQALKMISELEMSAVEGVKGMVKNVLGEDGVNTLKKILKGGR